MLSKTLCLLKIKTRQIPGLQKQSRQALTCHDSKQFLCENLARVL